jgi:short-subunit dehydrogenase
MEDWIILSKTVIETCFNIRGQTAIVTGASSGLGVMFAETLAELGVNLVIAARRYKKLVKVAENFAKPTTSKLSPSTRT